MFYYTFNYIPKLILHSQMRIFKLQRNVKLLEYMSTVKD